MNEVNEAIARAIKVFGSQAAMAFALDVKQPTISEWLRCERPVPAERCPQIEELTKGVVRCEELRNDVRWDVLLDRAQGDDEPKPLPKPKAEHPEPAPQAASEQEHTDSTTHRRGEDTNDDPFKARNTAQANELAKALGMQQRESDKPSRERGGR